VTPHRHRLPALVTEIKKAEKERGDLFGKSVLILAEENSAHNLEVWYLVSKLPAPIVITQKRLSVNAKINGSRTANNRPSQNHS